MHETQLSKQTVKYLNKLRAEGKPVYKLNIHGGGWTEKGAPDIIILINGYYVALELKVNDNDMSEAQKIHRKRILHAGGYHYTPRSIEEVRNIVKGWLNENKRC